MFYEKASMGYTGKMKAWVVSLLLMKLALVVQVESATQFPPEIGGGTDGVNGNEFLTGTADTAKIEISTHCSRTNSSASTIDLSMNFYMKDTSFRYSDIGPLDNDFVEYSCFLTDAKEHIDNDNVVIATVCSTSIELARVDSVNPIDTGFATRTFSTTITGFDPTDSATYSCGGFYDTPNNQAVFSVACKRKDGYDKAFDSAFVVYYEADTDVCVTRQMDASADVGGPPTVVLNRQFDVTFKGFRNLDVDTTPWPNGPMSTDGDHANSIQEITSDAVVLGEPIYFEICLINPQTPADSPYTQFFEDGYGLIGIYVEKCTARNDAALGTDGIDPDTPVTIIEDGCGLGVDPTEMLGKAGSNNGRGFMYVKDTIDGTKDWLTSPNCFRSYSTPAVSFARQNGALDAVTVYECELEYILSSDDTRCFGDKTKDREGYPVCARKKRETTNNATSRNTADFPKKVSLAIRVTLPEHHKHADDFCTEMTMLTVLTTLLAMVLLAILAVAVMMAYNLWSVARTDNRSVSSVVGFVNKGFYH